MNIGQRVYCSLKAFGFGYVSNINNDDLNIVFDNNTIINIHKKHLCNGLWKIFDTIIQKNDIEQILKKSKMIDPAEMKKIEKDFSYTRKDILLEYPYLTVGDGITDVRTAIKNIRLFLRHNFKEFGFRVKCERNGGVRILNQLGDTNVSHIDLKNLINIFETGSFTNMDNVSEYRKFLFCSIFGGVRYIIIE